ncbi:NADPH oxidase 5-like isoform X2 [Littorina saxatilis]|uniref:NADPH oxidase 5-like isoform X2 n=1 Tax=Littorina saxatilis TaxID=31220 RepID=UPI0038B51902
MEDKNRDSIVAVSFVKIAIPSEEPKAGQIDQHKHIGFQNAAFEGDENGDKSDKTNNKSDEIKRKDKKHGDTGNSHKPTERNGQHGHLQIDNEEEKKSEANRADVHKHDSIQENQATDNNRDVLGHKTSVAETLLPATKHDDGVSGVAATTNENNPPRKYDAYTEDEKTYAWIEKQFRAITGPEETLNKETFKKALQVKKSFFADRLFELFDDDNSGTLDLNELLQGLQTLTKGTPTEKLQFLFRIYDADNSGTISREELGTVLRSCMEESSLVLSEENLESLTDALFDDADTDGSGSITFEELKCQLEKHPGVMQNLTISAARWLMPPKKNKRVPSPPRYLTWTYLVNNRVKVIFTILYFLLNCGFFALNSWLYRASNWYIIIARGAGMCLDFNCAFVIVLMLRKSLTFLRNTPLVKVLPFDQHVMFHKLAGYYIVLFTLVHTAAHLGNAAVYLTKTKNLNLAEILFTLKADVGWVFGFAPLSGVILDVILAVMVICSMDFVRRSGFFEVFYWTHKLYIPFLVLNILHSPNFWKWIVGPAVIFTIELISRMSCIRAARHGQMFIETVKLLPSGVTQLCISRPVSYTFKPGDYVFINIPVLAQYEWHPFTISSAPEMQGSFHVHIRSAGHWTRMVYNYFEELESSQADAELGQSVSGKKNLSRLRSIKDAVSFRRRNTKARKILESRKKRVKTVKVHIPVNVDGPYGTPSRHIFEAEHAVLIGSGIGVTPFASILQSIMYRFKEAEVSCPNCAYRFSADIPKTVMALKKVDFVWINRDQRNFEWFVSLRTTLEKIIQYVITFFREILSVLPDNLSHFVQVDFVI